MTYLAIISQRRSQPSTITARLAMMRFFAAWAATPKTPGPIVCSIDAMARRLTSPQIQRNITWSPHHSQSGAHGIPVKVRIARAIVPLIDPYDQLQSSAKRARQAGARDISLIRPDGLLNRLQLAIPSEDMKSPMPHAIITVTARGVIRFGR